MTHPNNDASGAFLGSPVKVKKSNGSIFSGYLDKGDFESSHHEARYSKRDMFITLQTKDLKWFNDDTILVDQGKGFKPYLIDHIKDQGIGISTIELLNEAD